MPAQPIPQSSRPSTVPPSNAPLSTASAQPSRQPEPGEILVVRLRDNQALLPNGEADRERRGVDADFFALPSRKHPSDAGLDLEATSFFTVQAGFSALVPHNLAIVFPPGYYGLIVPRSSTLQHTGLIVLPGVLDPGFRGEVKTVVFNASRRNVRVNARDRLSQLLVLPIPQALKVSEVAFGEFPRETDRGAEGFGSTGGFLPSR